MELEKAIVIGRALSDANRLRILTMLSESDQCGSKLLEGFEMTQPTLSYHMKILCNSELVKCNPEGRWCRYSLQRDVLRAYLSELKKLLTDEAEVTSGVPAEGNV